MAHRTLTRREEVHDALGGMPEGMKYLKKFFVCVMIEETCIYIVTY